MCKREKAEKWGEQANDLSYNNKQEKRLILWEIVEISMMIKKFVKHSTDLQWTKDFNESTSHVRILFSFPTVVDFEDVQGLTLNKTGSDK